MHVVVGSCIVDICQASRACGVCDHRLKAASIVLAASLSALQQLVVQAAARQHASWDNASLLMQVRSAHLVSILHIGHNAEADSAVH